MKNRTNQDAARYRLIRAAVLFVVGVPALVAYLTLGSAEAPVDEEAAARRLESMSTAELCAWYCSRGEWTDFCCEVCETCPITGEE